jgi:hypothetical protein
MAERKRRVPLDRKTAARVLYLSDRTCCICRSPGKPIQIHHVDENPANNNEENLAVLCLDCHHLTQITGGFGRQLDADQVTLYRNDWLSTVKRQRGEGHQWAIEDDSEDVRLELATCIAEIYRENKEYTSLAMHYHAIGNESLRDKYIELVLREMDPDDLEVIFLRGSLQNRPDLIQDEVAQRVLDIQEQAEDWSQRARTLRDLRRWKESTRDYCRSILNSLDNDRTFSAAYYLKELCREKISEQLFLEAFSETDELWWKIRALDELDDHTGLTLFLRENEAEIRASGNLSMIEVLEIHLGNKEAYVEVRKQLAASEVDLGDGIIGYVQDRDGDQEESED